MFSAWTFIVAAIVVVFVLGAWILRKANTRRFEDFDR